MTTMQPVGSLLSEISSSESANIHIQQREKNLRDTIDHRKDLIKAIASLPKKSSLEQVKSAIDPLYEKIEALLVENLSLVDVDGGGDPRDAATQKITSDVKKDDDDASVTPLMVACNKEQIHCLEYFAGKYSHSEKTTCEDEDEDKDDISNPVSVGDGNPPPPKNHRTTHICNIIGHCLDATHLDGMNQAIHYAALSQMEPQAIDYLATILHHEECCHVNFSGSSQKEKQKEKQAPLPSSLPLQIKSKSPWDAYMKLLSQRNQNGDTPIMMAAAAGNSNILNYWISTLEKDAISTVTLEEQSANLTPFNSNSAGRAIEVVKLLSLSNNTKASALSLASGHGHVKVVELLVSYSDGPPGINGRPGIGIRSPYKYSVSVGRVNVRYEDMKRIKEILAKMKLVEISRKVPSVRLEEFKSQQRNIQQCLVMMQVASAKLSEDISAELLSESDKSSGKDDRSQSKSQSKSRNKSKTTKQKKISKDRLKKQQRIQTKTEISNGNEIMNVSKCNESTQRDTRGSQDDDNVHIEKPSFVTLENGTVVSKVDAMSYKVAMTSPNMVSNQINASSSNPSKPIQTLLRDRCLQTHKNVSSSTSSAKKSEAEEVMESLCLDASMLLLPPHGLAMNLSPSQLEAVENVLMIQISAVREAKDIHRRLMTSNNSTSESDKNQ